MIMAAVGDQQERKRGALDQSQGAFLRFGSAVRGSGVTVMAANLGLAAVYLVCGKLGLSLAVVHANATPVWPPTGVALAALLIWGYRLWPGIFLGAFLVNLSTSGTLAT